MQSPLLADRWVDRPATASLFLGLAVFVACLIGIMSRPADFLASLWPANSIMLGLLLRMPASAGPAGWLFGGAAFMAADMLTGSAFATSLLLNSANIVSVYAAYAIYSRFATKMALLRDPASMLYLMLAAAVAAAISGAIGGLLNPLLFDHSAPGGWALWSTSEFSSYIAILPVLLSAPSLHKLRARRRKQTSTTSWRNLAPIATLVVSCVAAVFTGGLGAIALPVPALLWCGLTYSIFPTAVLTLLFSSWTLILISTGFLPNAPFPSSDFELALARLGVSLIAVVPLMVATVMASHNELLSRLNYLATRDPLTDFLNRGAFLDNANRKLKGGEPFGVLMIDIDFFKEVNDLYGHAAGDEALVTFAKRARGCVRAEDLIGRIGGEEFALLIHAGSPDELHAVSERIRQSVSTTPIALTDGRQVTITVSIGTCFVPPSQTPRGIDSLLAKADKALYTSKHAGRNRITNSADMVAT